MACLFSLALAAVFAVCHAVPHLEARTASGKLSPDQIKRLTSKYGLMKAPFGDFLFGVLYNSPDTTILSSGETSLAASYLIVVDGVCEGFLEFPETDRIYTWVEGKAIIDVAKPDGSIEPVCLGDTLKDSKCVYSLTIPSHCKSDIRANEGFIIYTATTINGAVSNGRPVSMEEMKAEYGEKNGKILDEIVAADCQ